MKKIFLLFLLCISLCNVTFAFSGKRICIDVVNALTYESMTPENIEWRTYLYNIVAKKFKDECKQTTDFGYVVRLEYLRMYDISKGVEAFEYDEELMQKYNDFRASLFDHILEFYIDRYITFEDLGMTDIVITLKVKDASNIKGEPLAVYQDFRMDIPNSKKDEVFREILYNLVNQYYNGK